MVGLGKRIAGSIPATRLSDREIGRLIRNAPFGATPPIVSRLTIPLRPDTPGVYSGELNHIPPGSMCRQPQQLVRRGRAGAAGPTIASILCPALAAGALGHVASIAVRPSLATSRAHPSPGASPSWMVAHDLEVDDAAAVVVLRGGQTTIAAAVTTVGHKPASGFHSKCNTMAMTELRRPRTRVSNSRDGCGPRT